MNICGIDPGFTGAIANIDADGNVNVIDMPVIVTLKKGKKGKTSNKNELDGVGVYQMLHIMAPEHVYIEKAQTMPGQGIASSGRYMDAYGQIKGICIGAGIPYTLVHPKTWKKVIMPDMGKEKGEAIVRVRQLFPQVELPLKKDHGKADALLICEYGRRVHK